MTYAPDHALIATPIGMVRIIGGDDAVARIHIESGQQPERCATMRAVREAEAQVRLYFEGSLRRFDMPLEPFRTERGEIMRAGIASVGYGETLSYGGVARAIGSGPRAIGQACARNPYPLVIPCHRILAGGGRLGNYSAGDGAESKLWLLRHEAHHIGKDVSWAL